MYSLISKGSARGSRSALHHLRGPAMGLALVLAAGAAQADEPGFFVGVQGGASLLKSTNVNSTSGGTSVATDGVKFKSGYVGGLSTGYTFQNGLRPELELAYHRNGLDSGGGDVRSETATANLYYNFSQAGYYFYLGGGGGYAILKANLDSLGSDTDYRAIYSAGTGFGLSATRALTVGFDYRFLGAFERADFTGSSNGTPVSNSLRYRGSEITLSLRYSFGSFGGTDGPGIASEPVRIVPVSQ